MCVCQYFNSKTDLCKNITQCLKQQYHTDWLAALENSNKCLVYKNFKTNFGLEKYITELPDVYVFPMIRFRCSCHKLAIEVGRYKGIPKEERFCTWCDMNEIGDEFHFVFQCPKFSELREKFVPQKYRLVKSMFSLCNLFQSKKASQLKFAKYIKFSKIV